MSETTEHHYYSLILDRVRWRKQKKAGEMLMMMNFVIFTFPE
jgi:hypothetical protein